MKYSSLLMLLILVVTGWACRPKDPTTTDNPKTPPPEQQIKGNIKLVVDTNFQGNIEQYAIIETTGQRHGKYMRMRPDSSIIEEAFYKEGLLDGLRILYYENRDTQVLETHQKGQFHGPYLSYYESGGLRLEGIYTENSMEGLWYQYYETGELMEEVTFTENQENGPFVEYHKNGQISVEGSYLDGDNEHGELKFYNEEGIHFKTMECDKGLCRTVWKLEEESF